MVTGFERQGTEALVKKKIEENKKASEDFAKEVAKKSGKKVTYTISGGGATQITTGTVSRTGKIISQQTLSTDPQMKDAEISMRSGSAKVRIRQEQLQQRDIESRVAKALIARQRVFSDVAQGKYVPQTATQLQESAIKVRQSTQERNERVRISKKYTKIVNDKLKEGEKVTAGELFQAQFGARKVDLKELTAEKIKEVENIVEFQTKVYAPGPIENLLTAKSNLIWKLVLKQKDFPIVVKLTEQINFIRGGGSVSIARKSFTVRLVNALLKATVPHFALTSRTNLRVLKEKFLKLKNTLTTKEGLIGVGRTAISPAIGVFQSIKEFTTFPQIVKELVILNVALKKGPKNKSFRKVILNRLDYIEKKASKFGRDNKKYKQDVANALIIEAFLLTKGGVTGIGAVLGKVSVKSVLLTKTLKAMAALPVKSFNLFGKVAVGGILTNALIDPSPENVGYVVQIAGLTYLPKVAKYVSKIPSGSKNAMYVVKNKYVYVSKSGKKVLITSKKVIAKLDKLYKSKIKSKKITTRDPELYLKSKGIRVRYVDKQTMWQRSWEDAELRPKVWAEIKKWKLGKPHSFPIGSAGKKSVFIYRGLKGKELTSTLRHEAIHILKGDAGREKSLVWKTFPKASRSIMEFRTRFLTRFNIKFPLSKAQAALKVKLNKLIDSEMFRVFGKTRVTARKGALPKDVKLKLQSQGFKSLKELNKVKTLFAKFQKGDIKAGKELDRIERIISSRKIRKTAKAQIRQRARETRGKSAKELKLAQPKPKLSKPGQKTLGQKPKDILRKEFQRVSRVENALAKERFELRAEQREAKRLKKSSPGSKKLRKQQRKIILRKFKMDVLMSDLQLQKEKYKFAVKFLELKRRPSSSRQRKIERKKFVQKVAKMERELRLKNERLNDALRRERLDLRMKQKSDEKVVIDIKPRDSIKTTPSKLTIEAKGKSGRVTVRVVIDKTTNTRKTYALVDKKMQNGQIMKVMTLVRTQKLDIKKARALRRANLKSKSGDTQKFVADEYLKFRKAQRVIAVQQSKSISRKARRGKLKQVTKSDKESDKSVDQKLLRRKQERKQALLSRVKKPKSSQRKGLGSKIKVVRYTNVKVLVIPKNQLKGMSRSGATALIALLASKSIQSSLSGSRFKVLSVPKTIPQVKSLQSSDLAIKYATTQEQIAIVKAIQDVASVQDYSTVVISSTKLSPKVAQELLQGQDLIQKTKLKTVKKPPIILNIPKLNWRTKVPRGYSRIVSVLVKEKGRIKRLTLKTTENRAYAIAIKYVDNKIIRSFDLELLDLRKVKDTRKPSLRKFRGKIGKNPRVLRVVEKTKYTIDKPGEVRDLKIAKSRKKRKK